MRFVSRSITVHTKTDFTESSTLRNGWISEPVHVRKCTILNIFEPFKGQNPHTQYYDGEGPPQAEIFRNSEPLSHSGMYFS